MSSDRLDVLLFASRDDGAHSIASPLCRAGHHVDRVNCAEDALRRSFQAAVILLDGLPLDLDLPSFCRRLRTEPVSSRVPLLLLTHWPAPVLPPEVDAFLYHPICPSQLIAQVELLARLRFAQGLYDSLVSTLPIPIYHTDPLGRLTFVNRQFCQRLHRSEKELLGRTEADFAIDDHLLTSGDPANGKGIDPSVLAELTPDGTMRYVQRLEAPLRSPGGELIGVHGMFWDVTARRHADDAAAESAVARRIQQKLFPASNSPLVHQAAHHGIELGGASYPADAVGGDCYDWLPLSEDGIGVALGDVSGHGAGAALMMAETRAYSKATSSTAYNPDEVLARVNQLMSDDLEGDRFVTLLLGRLDPRARTFSYSSAGHPTGYILDGRGDVKHTLPSLDVPLGIHRHQTFRTSEPISLSTGDIVILLTDGIVEAQDPQGQPFTAARVLEMVWHYRRAPATQIARNLYHAARAFALNRPQQDDMTSVIIKVHERPVRKHRG